MCESVGEVCFKMIEHILISVHGVWGWHGTNSLVSFRMLHAVICITTLDVPLVFLFSFSASLLTRGVRLSFQMAL